MSTCVKFTEESGDLCFFEKIRTNSQSACEIACTDQPWCVGIQMNTSLLGQSSSQAHNCEILGDAETSNCDLAQLMPTRVARGTWTVISRECFDKNYSYIRRANTVKGLAKGKTAAQG